MPVSRRQSRLSWEVPALVIREIETMRRAALAAMALALFGSATVFAADLRRSAPIVKAPAPVAVFDWTGLYVGGYVGIGVNASRGLDPRLAGNAGELRVIGSG